MGSAESVRSSVEAPWGLASRVVLGVGDVPVLLVVVVLVSLDQVIGDGDLQELRRHDGQFAVKHCRFLWRLAVAVCADHSPGARRLY